MHFKTTNLDLNFPMIGQGGATTIEEILLQLQQKPASFSRKVSKITSRLAGFSKSTDAFLQLSPDYTAIIWGSVKLILPVAQISKVEM